MKNQRNVTNFFKILKNIAKLLLSENQDTKFFLNSKYVNYLFMVSL